MNDNLLMPDSKSPRADAARNHDLLLDTARALFKTEGVAAVTMSEIAKRAGVGKGTLYRHFGDKAEICHALLDQDMRDLQDHTLRRLRGNNTPLEHLHWFLEQAARFVEQNSDLLCEASNHAAVSLLEHPAHSWWRQTILGLFRQMRSEGDLEYSTDVLYAMLDVQMIRFQKSALGYDMNRIVAGLTDTATSLTR